MAQSLELRVCKHRDEALALLTEPSGPSGLLMWESSESIPLALSDPQRLSQPCILAAITALASFLIPGSTEARGGATHSALGCFPQGLSAAGVTGCRWCCRALQVPSCWENVLLDESCLFPQ